MINSGLLSHSIQYDKGVVSVEIWISCAMAALGSNFDFIRQAKSGFMPWFDHFNYFLAHLYFDPDDGVIFTASVQWSEYARYARKNNSPA